MGKPKTKPKPKATSKATSKTSAPKRMTPAQRVAQQTPAESDYSSGYRLDPPQLHEMSAASQEAVRSGFTNSMSGWRDREQARTDAGGTKTLTQSAINRLDNRIVDIPTAARNLSNVWDRMVSSDNRPAPAWYFGHHRRMAKISDDTGIPTDTVIDASAGMSPQNGPDDEHRAAAAMADAISNKRRVTFKGTGKSRALTAMSSRQMTKVTSAKNAKNISVDPDFDVAGFRHAGTNRIGGWETMKGKRNAVAEMETAKVPLYAKAIKMSVPDTPLHAEYEARFGDQMDARRVNMGRAADAAAGRTGSETLRGVMDRVDTYGLMGRGSDDDDTDPIHDHPILGKRGIAVPDTWMAAMLSGQDMLDNADSVSPAKLAGSATKTTSSNVPGNTFATPAEVNGGKKFTGNAAWGMAAVEAIQQAAELSREPGSQTNIPPVMMQEMTWVHGRNEVAESTRQTLAATGKKRGSASLRIKKLTSGSLTGLKEFRGAKGSRDLSTIETPGSFHRGSNNPLDTDSVRIIHNPGSQSRSSAFHAQAGTNAVAPELDSFHSSASGPAPSEIDKRRAIKAALEAHSQERSARGITDNPLPSR